MLAHSLLFVESKLESTNDVNTLAFLWVARQPSNLTILTPNSVSINRKVTIVSGLVVGNRFHFWKHRSHVGSLHSCFCYRIYYILLLTTTTFMPGVLGFWGF